MDCRACGKVPLWPAGHLSHKGVDYSGPASSSAWAPATEFFRLTFGRVKPSPLWGGVGKGLSARLRRVEIRRLAEGDDQLGAGHIAAFLVDLDRIGGDAEVAG